MCPFSSPDFYKAFSGGPSHLCRFHSLVAARACVSLNTLIPCRTLHMPWVFHLRNTNHFHHLCSAIWVKQLLDPIWLLGDHTHSMLLHYSLPFPSASFLPHSVHLHSHNLPHFTYKYSFIHLILRKFIFTTKLPWGRALHKSIHYISFTHPFAEM